MPTPSIAVLSENCDQSTVCREAILTALHYANPLRLRYIHSFNDYRRDGDFPHFKACVVALFNELARIVDIADPLLTKEFLDKVRVANAMNPPRPPSYSTGMKRHFIMLRAFVSVPSQRKLGR